MISERETKAPSEQPPSHLSERQCDLLEILLQKEGIGAKELETKMWGKDDYYIRESLRLVRDFLNEKISFYGASILRVGIRNRPGVYRLAFDRENEMSPAEIASRREKLIRLIEVSREEITRKKPQESYTLPNGKVLTNLTLEKKELLEIVFSRNSVSRRELAEEIYKDINNGPRRVTKLIRDINEILEPNGYRIGRKLGKDGRTCYFPQEEQEEIKDTSEIDTSGGVSRLEKALEERFTKDVLADFKINITGPILSYFANIYSTKDWKERDYRLSKNPLEIAKNWLPGNNDLKFIINTRREREFRELFVKWVLSMAGNYWQETDSSKAKEKRIIDCCHIFQGKGIDFSFLAKDICCHFSVPVPSCLEFILCERELGKIKI